MKGTKFCLIRKQQKDVKRNNAEKRKPEEGRGKESYLSESPPRPKKSIMFSQTATLSREHYILTGLLQHHTHTRTHTATTTHISGPETAHDKF